MRKEGPTPGDVLAYQQTLAEHIDRYGFSIRAVFGYDIKREHNLGDRPFFDFHTVGLMESFGHPELQIIYPLPQSAVQYIFHTIVNECIKKGHVLEDGEFLEGMLNEDYKMKVVKINHPNVDGQPREFLRLLMPDKDNQFPTVEEAPESPFAYQLEELDYEMEDV